MNNIVHIYHLRDQYDHSLGYTTHNTYNNLADDTIEEVISKQERYMKGNELGGYWVQIITYTVGNEPIIVNHIKTVPQKTRIELNIKAKGGKRKSIEQALNELNANMVINPNNFFAQPVAVANHELDWQGGEILLEDAEEHE